MTNPFESIPRRRFLTAASAAGLGLAAVRRLFSYEPRTDLAAEKPARIYDNRFTLLKAPPPLLADYPEFVQPIQDLVRYEAAPLVVDEEADLSVRAWRWSYNARGIIEIPNLLKASQTALIVVHPWGIDDGQGWQTPQPAGCADFGTPAKNHLCHEHIVEVLNPFVKSMRPGMGLVLYSQPGGEDPIRKKLYRSFRGKPTPEERAEGSKELEAKLKSFNYNAGSLPEKLTLWKDLPAVDYFRQFPGSDAGDHYNGAGFWSLPIPIVKCLEYHPDDVLVYDAEGYPPLRGFLKKHGIRHVLLTGYATDMCYKATTAGYQNLRKDFNVFLVGDATMATFPANSTPAYATNVALSFASLENLITQISWIKPVD